MTAHTPIRLRAAAMLAGLSLMLSSCFVSPGKFTSELTLLENDQFTFTYEGEVYFLGLSRWIKEQQSRDRAGSTFRAYCYGPVKDSAAEAAEAAADAVEAAVEEASVEVETVSTVAVAEEPYAAEAVADDVASGRRDCTPEEEAEQRERWEERQERRRERDRQQAEQISAIIGGIDPTDPEAEKKLAEVLMRQKGFKSVVAKGDGLFEVSYSISGTLSHDYMFPMMEDFPTTNPFVQLFLRDGDRVRVNALGFAPQSINNPMTSLMTLAGGFPGGRSNEMEALSDIPATQGTFTIVTTGDILANNTDEGPTNDGARKRLTWTIDASTKATPTALIKMPR